MSAMEKADTDIENKPLHNLNVHSLAEHRQCLDCESRRREDQKESRMWKIIFPIYLTCFAFFFLYLHFSEDDNLDKFLINVDSFVLGDASPFASTLSDIYLHRALKDDLCPQADRLFPEANSELWKNLSSQVSSDSFKEKAIAWLGGAVRIPTESFDKMDPVGIDPRWEEFRPFHTYLEKSFPLVHSNLKLTKVNTYGLVYEWTGSDESLKPILMAAHQDVVPVDPRTVDEWTHPPFSGFYDGEYIWGRGSSDDKSGLIGTMSAIETLLKAGFAPTRSVVLSFGFDEEVSGIRGAQGLGKYLEAHYGKDAFAMIIDEGGGYSEQYGTVFAIPAIGEKGAFDTRVEVSAPGGHSSVPPKHTSIGMLASLLVEFESNPFKVSIDRNTPIYKTMLCNAVHSSGMDRKLRMAILRSPYSKLALKKLERLIDKDPILKSAVGTTTAIDLVQGGVKANALPEQAWAVVDHRIATQSNVEAVAEHDTNLLKKLAKDFDLNYNAFGQNLVSGSSGSLTLTDAWGTALEPAPVSPTDEAPYKLLSGTIRASFDTRQGLIEGKEIKIAPGIMTGNTDTRYYWNLTKHIFRYNHNSGQLTGNKGIPSGVHTVNEHIRADDFVEMIRFFVTFILNADENEL